MLAWQITNVKSLASFCAHIAFLTSYTFLHLGPIEEKNLHYTPLLISGHSQSEDLEQGMELLQFRILQGTFL